MKEQYHILSQDPRQLNGLSGLLLLVHRRGFSDFLSCTPKTMNAGLDLVQHCH